MFAPAMPPANLRPTPTLPHFTLTLPLAVALLGACQSGADATPPIGEVQQISYEVVPTPLYELGMIDVTLEDATYAQLEAFTLESRDAMMADIIDAVGLGGAMLDTELTPGGFMLVTNPSLQSRLMASDAEVESLAAAIGYVYSQWSVLVTDFADKSGGTAFAVVSFDVERVDAGLGQDFFAHAATVDAGLGGGYFAFEGEVIYLNLRGPDGTPYSGLEDDEFIAMVEDAAASFAPYRAELSQSGEAAVIFVENDWSTAPTGEDYVGVLAGLDERSLADLADLQAEHTDRFKAAIAANGWD